MNKKKKFFTSLLTIFRVGTFLGRKQLRGASPWTTSLLIFIMMLTFLNLVVISGLLVGLIVGGNKANRESYTGDVFITAPKGMDTIEYTEPLINFIKTIPGITFISSRLSSLVFAEAHYKERADFTIDANKVGTKLVGIDIDNEKKLSHIEKFIVEGEFFNPNERGYIVVGAKIIDRYVSSFGDGITALTYLKVGDTLKLTSGEKTKEFIIKGIINTKVNQVSRNIFLPRAEYLDFIDPITMNAHEIAIKHDSVYYSDTLLSQKIRESPFSKLSKIRTAEESIPDFLLQIKTAFGLLGNVIGAISLIVAIVTVFILVFVNALTRKRFIGIQKAIGIDRRSIELAYVFQFVTYSIIGSALGILITYLVLVPHFAVHPLNFPFSDGILFVDTQVTLLRMFLLIGFTVLAGFIPAWLITSKNTLDSVLGK